MGAELSVPRMALARATATLAWGSALFFLLGLLYPGLPAGKSVPGGICLGLAVTAALLTGPPRELPGFTPPQEGCPIFRRCLSCILLGSSLFAVCWNFQHLPSFPWAVVSGFGARWLLYGLESSDLRAAAQGREALPCLATRLRRAVTWVTGALIPLLVWGGLPGFPLLALSFLLTFFGQWTAAGELFHARFARSSIAGPHPLR